MTRWTVPVREVSAETTHSAPRRPVRQSSLGWLGADLGEEGAPGGDGNGEDRARAVGGVAGEDAGADAAQCDAGGAAVAAVAGRAPAGVHCCRLFHCSIASTMSARESSAFRA